MRLLGLCVTSATLLCVLGGPTWAKADLPDIKSKAAIVLDADTGAEIFGKSADEVRPIASTTKIFVAMVARRRGIDLDGWTKITRTDVRAAERRYGSLASPFHRRRLGAQGRVGPGGGP